MAEGSWRATHRARGEHGIKHRDNLHGPAIPDKHNRVTAHLRCAYDADRLADLRAPQGERPLRRNTKGLCVRCIIRSDVPYVFRDQGIPAMKNTRRRTIAFTLRFDRGGQNDGEA